MQRHLNEKRKKAMTYTYNYCTLSFHSTLCLIHHMDRSWCLSHWLLHWQNWPVPAMLSETSRISRWERQIKSKADSKSMGSQESKLFSTDFPDGSGCPDISGNETPLNIELELILILPKLRNEIYSTYVDSASISALSLLVLR